MPRGGGLFEVLSRHSFTFYNKMRLTLVCCSRGAQVELFSKHEEKLQTLQLSEGKCGRCEHALQGPANCTTGEYLPAVSLKPQRRRGLTFSLKVVAADRHPVLQHLPLLGHGSQRVQWNASTAAVSWNVQPHQGIDVVREGHSSCGAVRGSTEHSRDFVIRVDCPVYPVRTPFYFSISS